MSLTILFMLLFSALLLLWEWRNKYYQLFILMMLGMSLAMVGLLVEVSKISNYLIPAGHFSNALEIHIYRLIYSFVRIPASLVTVLRNVGIVLYLTAIVLFVYSFYNSTRHDSRRKNARWVYALYALPVLYLVLFFLFYHPETAYTLYLHYHLSDSPAQQRSLVRMVEMLHALFTTLTAVYLCFPVFYLTRNHLQNRITFFSEQLASLAMSLGLLNLSFFAMFFTGVFRHSVDSVFAYGFWRYRMPTQIPILYTTYLPIITLCVLSVVFFVMVRFHTGQLVNAFRARRIRRNLDALYVNIRNLMHSKKNLMFSIRILAERALAETSGEGTANIQQIVDICDVNLQETTKLLNTIQNSSVHATQHNFIDAVEQALLEQSMPEGVTIHRDYQQPNIPLRFDLYQITESISNILGNAIDALAESGREDAAITLTVYASNSWVFFSARDNGTGIPRKLVKKVYRPYVSTKRRGKSWGIGLSYVFSVIKAHDGHIRVRSKPGRETTVELLLPRYRTRRKGT